MKGMIAMLTLAALLGASACGGKDADRAAGPGSAGEAAGGPAGGGEAVPVDAQAAPARPEDAASPGGATGAPTTPDECRAAGGTFVPSIGNEPTCPDGKRSLGPVRFGVEGGICCK